MDSDQILVIISSLSKIDEDDSIPKNIRLHIKNVIITLEEGKQVNIKINRALEGLEEVNRDPNLPMYTRTQIWSMICALEQTLSVYE